MVIRLVRHKFEFLYDYLSKHVDNNKKLTDHKFLQKFYDKLSIEMEILKKRNYFIDSCGKVSSHYCQHLEPDNKTNVSLEEIRLLDYKQLRPDSKTDIFFGITMKNIRNSEDILLGFVNQENINNYLKEIDKAQRLSCHQILRSLAYFDEEDIQEIINENIQEIIDMGKSLLRIKISFVTKKFIENISFLKQLRGVGLFIL